MSALLLYLTWSPRHTQVIAGRHCATLQAFPVLSASLQGTRKADHALATHGHAVQAVTHLEATGDGWGAWHTYDEVPWGTRWERWEIRWDLQCGESSLQTKHGYNLHLVDSGYSTNGLDGTCTPPGETEQPVFFIVVFLLPPSPSACFFGHLPKRDKGQKKYMSCKRTTSMSFLRLKLKNIKHKTTWGHRHLHRTSRWRTCWRPWRSTSDADRKGFPLTAGQLQFLSHISSRSFEQQRLKTWSNGNWWLVKLTSFISSISKNFPNDCRSYHWQIQWDEPHDSSAIQTLKMCFNLPKKKKICNHRIVQRRSPWNVQLSKRYADCFEEE